jgi:hypothetical protein
MIAGWKEITSIHGHLAAVEGKLNLGQITGGVGPWSARFEMSIMQFAVMTNV